MASRISISDFGPVAHADLEIKPLSILIGPNGSGKSYVALSIYSLTRAIRESVQPFRSPTPAFRRVSAVGGHSAQERRQITSILKGAMAEIQSFLSGEAQLQDMPSAVRKLVEDQWRTRTEAIGHSIDYELRRCFGTPLDQLGRRNRQIDRGQFEINIQDELTNFRWWMRCRSDELIISEWDPGKFLGQTSVDPERSLPRQVLLDNPDYFLYLVMEESSKLLLNDFSVRSHYLPASRSGILQGHKTLTSLIVGRASRAWIERMDVATLPGVITDLIEALLELGRPSPHRPQFESIVEFLETIVTKGSVDVETLADYPDITYQNEAGPFKLHEVSSMVSEIAPLVLFLKYLIRPGDLFIFEEPESHLDPANQGNLARAIAMMVNAGIKVMVTTHSDIFLNQINNLMQISQTPSRIRGRMGYKATEVLQPADVGAYLFHSNVEGGSRVERLAIDAEYGISTASFDSVHRALYDEATKLEHIGRN